MSDIIQYSVLVRKVSAGFIIKVINQFLMFIALVLLARAMDDEEYGIFVFALAILNILRMISGAGTGFTVVRFLPAFIVSSDWSRYQGILRWSVYTVTGVSLILAIFLYMITGALTYDEIFQNREIWLIVSITLPVLAYVTLKESILKSVKEIVAGLTPNLIIRPAVLIVSLLLLNGYMARAIDSRSAVILYLMASVAAMLAVWIAGRLYLPAIPAHNKPVLELRRWYVVSSSMFMISILQIGMSKIDIMVLGFMVSVEEVGYYSAASRIAALVSFGQFALGSVMAVVFSECHENNSPASTKAELLRSTKMSMLIGGLLLLCAVMIGPALLGIFGDNFVQATVTLYILALSSFVVSAYAMAKLSMMMSGNEKQVGMITFSAIALNIVLNILLIPRLGINGAAVATLLSQCVILLVVGRIVNHKVRTLEVTAPTSTLND